jgi:acyl carrier protein
VSATVVRHRIELFLRESGRVTDADLARQAPLISSGLVNSVTLFSLALLLEELTGRPIDVSRLNLPDDWDSVERIVAFVGRLQSLAHDPTHAAPESR